MTPLEVYKKLYRIADHILKDLNPCQFQVDAEGRATCIRNREWGNFDHPGPHIGPTRHAESNGCCTGCKKLGPQGCTVDSLDCKTFICGYISQTDKVAVISLRAIREASRMTPGLSTSSFWMSSDELVQEGSLRG